MLRPNNSLSWRGAIVVLCALAVVPVTVSVVLAWQGLWPVLPFAGAELLAMAAAFYVCGRRGEEKEVVIVDPVAVSVEKGRAYPTEIWSLPRAWVDVSLRTARYLGHPSQLMLASHGTAVGLGEFLTEEERATVARQLRGVLRNV